VFARRRGCDSSAWPSPGRVRPLAHGPAHQENSPRRAGAEQHASVGWPAMVDLALGRSIR
jgi:hypothetical protein